MTRVHFVVAFVAGCVTAGAAGWMTTSLRAQAPAPVDNVIHVCAGADNVLHMTTPFAACPAGQPSLFLRKGAAGPSAAASSGSGSSDARIKALEARIAALEGQAARMGQTQRVTAPFEVDDRGGKRVFSVGENRVVSLYNSLGKDVVRLSATDSGALMTISNGAASLGVALGAGGQNSGLTLLETGGRIRAELGSNPETGSYRLVFTMPNGQRLAGIGQFPNTNAGTAFVSENNIAKAGMTVSERKGLFYVANGQQTIVASLTEGDVAGGLLQLSSSKGTPMVEAGVTSDAFGVVRTGPASFMTAAGLGLPGSYIMGKAK